MSDVSVFQQVFEPYLTISYYFLIAFPILIFGGMLFKYISKISSDDFVHSRGESENTPQTIEREEREQRYRYEQEQINLTREHDARMAIAAEQVQEYRRQMLGRTTTHEDIISPQAQGKSSQIKEQKTKHDPSERFENIIE